MGQNRLSTLEGFSIGKLIFSPEEVKVNITIPVGHYAGCELVRACS